MIYTKHEQSCTLQSSQNIPLVTRTFVLLKPQANPNSRFDRVIFTCAYRVARDQLKCVMFCIDTTTKDKNAQRNERLRFWRKETQNPFSDSFGFKNPILDFLEETHEWVIPDPIAAPALGSNGKSRESLVRSACSRRGLKLKFVEKQSQSGKCFTCNCKVIWLIRRFYMSQRFLFFKAQFWVFKRWLVCLRDNISTLSAAI